MLLLRYSWNSSIQNSSCKNSRHGCDFKCTCGLSWNGASVLRVPGVQHLYIVHVSWKKKAVINLLQWFRGTMRSGSVGFSCCELRSFQLQLNISKNLEVYQNWHKRASGFQDKLLTLGGQRSKVIINKSEETKLQKRTRFKHRRLWCCWAPGDRCWNTWRRRSALLPWVWTLMDVNCDFTSSMMHSNVSRCVRFAEKRQAGNQIRCQRTLNVVSNVSVALLFPIKAFKLFLNP